MLSHEELAVKCHEVSRSDSEEHWTVFWVKVLKHPKVVLMTKLCKQDSYLKKKKSQLLGSTNKLYLPQQLKPDFLQHNEVN